MNLDFFPPLNAILNGIAGLFLIAGFVQIKRGNKKGHASCMIGALTVSAIFLVSYVTFKTLKGNVHTSFPEGYPLARKFYYPMLISHIFLAVAMLPAIFMAVRYAIRQEFDKHRKVVKIAYPVWLYVSVTGVLVYFMLYQWFPPAASAGNESEGPARDAILPGEAADGTLVFEPEVFLYDAEMGETEMTATFAVRNTGDSPVSFTKLDSSCTCLSVESDKLKIPPGSEATLTAIFDISKMSGEAEKSLYVLTDIPGSHEIQLPVRVTIPPVLSLDPITVKWGLGAKAEPREFVFRVLRDEPIRVTEIKSSRESVRAELKTVEEGREYRIVLTPESTEETLLGFVRLSTDCELEQFRQMMGYYAVQNGN